MTSDKQRILSSQFCAVVITAILSLMGWAISNVADAAVVATDNHSTPTALIGAQALSQKSALILAMDSGGNAVLLSSQKSMDDYREERLLPELDAKGLREDAYYFFGYQFFVIGVLYISPQSVSGWSDEQKKNFTIEKYKKNTRQMIWDRDKFYINYILHPYWGMTYYVRARERGATHVGSFWYAELLSTLWEFGVEALFEPVSIQDLFVTPIMGAVIGRYVDTYRQSVKSKPVQSPFDNFMLGLTDPLGAANRGVNRLFGKTASVSFNYSIKNTMAYGYDSKAEQSGIATVGELGKLVKPRLGITFNYRF